MTDTLQSCALFKDWTSKDIERLSEIAISKPLNVGEILFTEGSTANSLILVQSGTIRIEVGAGDDDEAVAEFGTNSYFGEMGLLGKLSDGAKRSASATATEATKVLELSYANLTKLLEADPALAARFYRNIASDLSVRIQKTTKDLASLRSLRLRHI